MQKLFDALWAIWNMVIDIPYIFRMYYYALDPEDAKATELADNNAAIVDVLFAYIDRMQDVCPEDPAERIVEAFVKAVDPILEERWVIMGMVDADDKTTALADSNLFTKR